MNSLLEAESMCYSSFYHLYVPSIVWGRMLGPRNMLAKLNENLREWLESILNLEFPLSEILELYMQFDFGINTGW